MWGIDNYMATYRTKSFRCPDCNVVEHHVEDIDAIEKHLCPMCQGEMQLTIGAPRVMEASWPDGRKREDAYYLAKTANKIEAESFNLPPDKRAEKEKEVKQIRKEIKK